MTNNSGGGAMKTTTHTLIAIWMLCAPIGCGGGSEQALHWQGFWYDPASPTDRGTFQASLTTDGYRIRGTMTFTGFQHTDIRVDGEVDEHISGNHDFYTDVDLTSPEGITISFLEYGTGLTNDTTMSGSMTDENQSKDYYIYTVAKGFDMLPIAGALKAEVHSLSSFAVTDDESVWVYGRKTEPDPDQLHRLDAQGTITSSHDLNPMGAVMTWGAEQLWFVSDDPEPNTLASYHCTDLSQSGQVKLGGLPLFEKVNAIAYQNGHIWATTGMVNMQVISIDPATGDTKSKWNGEYSDLYAFAACGQHFMAIQWDRTGYLDSILVYDGSGKLQRSFVAPQDQTIKLTCDQTHLYTTTHQGWILKTPLSSL